MVVILLQNSLKETKAFLPNLSREEHTPIQSSQDNRTFRARIRLGHLNLEPKTDPPHVRMLQASPVQPISQSAGQRPLTESHASPSAQWQGEPQSSPQYPPRHAVGHTDNMQNKSGLSCSILQNECQTVARCDTSSDTRTRNYLLTHWGL